MSFLRKASTGVLRNFRPRAAQSEGKFFGEGARTDKNGLLFGETPTPPGQKRQWEDWEAPWYAWYSMLQFPELHPVLQALPLPVPVVACVKGLVMSQASHILLRQMHTIACLHRTSWHHSCRYAAMTAAALMLGFGLSSRPETSMMVWAKRQAKKELDAEAA